MPKCIHNPQDGTVCMGGGGVSHTVWLTYVILYRPHRAQTALCVLLEWETKDHQSTRSCIGAFYLELAKFPFQLSPGPTWTWQFTESNKNRRHYSVY